MIFLGFSTAVRRRRPASGVARAERQADFKTRPGAIDVLETQGPAVRASDERREIQAEAGAARVPGTRRVAAIERLADML